MEFAEAARLGNYISKDYARSMFGLLVNYRDISASEAASRLGIHIRTAQDFLEAMASLGILHREEVYERKRPYFRYSLVKPKIVMEIDLAEEAAAGPAEQTGGLIRERKNSSAMFSTAREGDRISSVTVWSGEGRERKQRRISLTGAQGAFLFHLPFPDASPSSISTIMDKAGIEDEYLPEILDMVDVLERNDVIEVHPESEETGRQTE